MTFSGNSDVSHENSKKTDSGINSNYPGMFEPENLKIGFIYSVLLGPPKAKGAWVRRSRW